MTKRKTDRSVRKNVEIRGENWEEMKENRKWENRDAGDFYVILDSCLWKHLKNDDDADSLHVNRRENIQGMIQ